MAHHAELITIHVDTPVPVTRARLRANRLSNERRDVDDGAFEVLLKGWEPPTAAEHPLVVSFAEDLNDWVERHASTLKDA